MTLKVMLKKYKSTKIQLAPVYFNSIIKTDKSQI